MCWSLLCTLFIFALVLLSVKTSVFSVDCLVDLGESHSVLFLYLVELLAKTGNYILKY